MNEKTSIEKLGEHEAKWGKLIQEVLSTPHEGGPLDVLLEYFNEPEKWKRRRESLFTPEQLRTTEQYSPDQK